MSRSTTRRWRAAACVGSLLLVSAAAAAQAPVRSIAGLQMPESAVVTPEGRVYLSEIGGFGKDGDGQISLLNADGSGQRVIATGLDDPKGLALRQGVLYVADRTRVMKVDAAGKVSVLADAAAFPRPPLFLNDVCIDAGGTLYVSDTGDMQAGGKGAIYAIAPDGKVTLVISESEAPQIKSPNGLLIEQPGTLLVADFATGELLRLTLASKKVEKLADGLGGADGLAMDAQGRLFISDWKGGRVFKFDLRKAGAKPELLPQNFQAAADIAMAADGKALLVPDMKAGTLTWLPTH